MKLSSFTKAGQPGYGALSGTGVVDLSRRFGDTAPNLRALLKAGALSDAARLVADAQPDFALSDVVLAPVIPDPDKIICVGLNYRDHVAETGRAQTEKPLLFARWAASQVGHGEGLVR